MAATHRGRLLDAKDKFLKAWSDPKEREWMELRPEGTRDWVKPDGLGEGLHFVRVGKSQIAQVRVMPGGRCVVT